MDRGTWQATVHGVARIRHDLATKPSPSYESSVKGILIFFFFPYQLFNEENRNAGGVEESSDGNSHE